MNRNEIALKFTLVILKKTTTNRTSLFKRIKGILGIDTSHTFISPFNEAIRVGFESADEFILKSTEDDASNAVITDSDYLTNK